MALAETVSANNATAVVYLMVFEIYRRGFAVLCAKAAFNTLVLVNTYLEPREASKEAEDSAHRTDCVTVCTAATPCKNGDDDERHNGDDECRHALNPHVNAVESVAVHALGYACKHVVSGLINRFEQVARDASVRTVRRKERHYDVNPG